MRKDNSIFKTKFISEPGSCLQNADYFAFVELQDYACYCIADGIDDDRKRHSAELAVSAVINAFYEKSGMSKRLMKHYAKVAHKELLKETRDIRLEASILILVTNYKKLRWTNVGNTRLYHLRNGKVLHKSIDQSLSQNLAEQGEIPLDRIEQHEERHNLYCYLGQPGSFRPYVSPKIKLEDGDIVTLCTRGIWENIGVPEILDSVEEASEPEDVCAGIEDIILSQQMRWISNYTIACIYINKVYQNPKRKKIIKKVAMIGTPILIMLLVLLVVFMVQNVKKENKIKMMWQQINSGIEDIDKNGKIFDETNTLKQAATSYEAFLSTDDSKKKEVIEAKGFIDTYNRIQEIETLEASEDISYMELYSQYARLLGLAKGKDYVELKRQEQGMEGEDYSLSIADTIDTTYLSEEAKQSYENIIAKYEKKFDDIMLNAKLENTYTATNDQYQDALSNTKNYIKSAKKSAVYDYDNNEELKNNILDLENAITSDDGKDKIDETLKKEIKDLLTKLKKLKYKIIGDAWKETANDAVDKGNNSDAVDALKEAQKAYKNADETDKAEECSDAVDTIKAEQQEKKTEKAEKEADSILKTADNLYANGSYDEAKTQYTSAKKKYDALKNDTKVSEINTKLENIECIEQAEKYEEEAKKSYKAKEYESAKEYYETAKEYYKEVNLTDKCIEITNLLKKVEKKIEAVNERKARQEEKEQEEKNSEE